MADAILCKPLPFTFGEIGSQTTVGPAVNLSSDFLGRCWRTTGSSWVVIDLGSSQVIDTVALLATNLLNTDAVRVRSSNTSGHLTGASPSGPFACDIDLGGHASPEAANRLHRSVMARPASINARYWRIDVSTGLTNFSAGRLVIGKSMQASDNFDYGWNFQVLDLGSTDTTPLGIEDSQLGAKVLAYQWTWSWLTEQEARGPLLDILAYAGTTRPVFFCFDPAATDLHNALAFGRIVERVQGVNYAANTWQAEFSLRSKLILSL